MKQRVDTTSPGSLVPLSVFFARYIYATLVHHVLSYRIILHTFLPSLPLSILALRLYPAWTPHFSVLYFKPCGRKDYYSFVSWTLVGLLLYYCIAPSFSSAAKAYFVHLRHGAVWCRMVGRGMDCRAAHVWCFLSNLVFSSRCFLLITKV